MVARPARKRALKTFCQNPGTKVRSVRRIVEGVAFMVDPHSPAPLDAGEHERIEAALAESERGRRFLTEFARRHRSTDTEILLQAMSRLESAVTKDLAQNLASLREADGVGRLRGDLVDMAESIARTRVEVAAMSAPETDGSRLSVASEALDAIVRATERATSDILGAAEAMQEAAWTLREKGSEAGLCDELDRRATEIYTACSFQDLTAQRTARVVRTLRYLEDRIAAMMGIWGGRLDAVPPHDAAAERAADLCQSDVDRFLGMEAATDVAMESGPGKALPPGQSFPAALLPEDEIAFVPERPAGETPPIAPQPRAGAPADARAALDANPGADLAAAFADLDRLSIEEKIALFS